MAVSFQSNAEPITGYRLIDRIGSGGFGEVWKCEAPGGIFKAMKVIYGDLRYKDNDSYRFAEQELKAMKRVKMVRHPYLLALDRYDIVDGRLCIVMELADCNLWDRFRECRAQNLQGIPRPELMQYLFESAEVLDLMNDKYQLQHLDIKPQNLFLLYNHVKVADFGQVKDLELHVAQVTGGITPVYAAPETFDGLVSRYCDQYSLACVFQELLTGQRPFDGTSMTQLMMQHLQHAPNLEPSPAADRPALARALSKKPEDRFHTVMDMAVAIRDGMRTPVSVRVEQAVGSGSNQHSEPTESLAIGNPPVHTGRTDYADPAYHSGSSVFHHLGSTASASQALDGTVDSAASFTPMPARTSVKEQKGDGNLRPTLIIGLGNTGVLATRRVRRLLSQAYGECDNVPILRTLAIDTYAENLTEAVTLSSEDLDPLPEEATLPIPLNRAAYYLRPRNNGRALFEGWLDPSVLYRMPRVPETTGLRCLGRLAFYDHFRTIMQRVLAELDIATNETALAISKHTTHQEARSNLPMVYLVAGLGGGTGSGIVFDFAYALRQLMRHNGYPSPDIVGVLLAPPNDGTVSVQAKANTFAAITELNHYSQADTRFKAVFDEAQGYVDDQQAPFSRTVILRGSEYAVPSSTVISVSQTQMPVRHRTGGRSTIALTGSLHRVLPGVPHVHAADSAKSLDQLAHFFRLELFSTLGRQADQKRKELAPPATPMFATFGLQRLHWPRYEVVRRAARVIAPVLLGHWIDPDPTQIRKVVPRWAAEQWQRYKLEADQLVGTLKSAVNEAVGYDLEVQVVQLRESLLPNGWLKRLPDANTVSTRLGELTRIFGPPRQGDDSTDLQRALEHQSKSVKKTIVTDWMAMIPALLDTSTFRLAGTEEVVRQLLVSLERNQQAVQRNIGEMEKAAALAFDRLTNYGFQLKGSKKLNANEFEESLNDYPRQWYDALVAREAVGIYSHLHDVMLNRLNELSACRQRIQEHHKVLVGEADRKLPEQPTGAMMPAGCTSLEDAAQRYLKVLNDDDLNSLENKFQDALSKQMGGVFESCLNTAEGPTAILRILKQTAQDYLDQRLGEVDFFAMMKQHHGSTQGVASTVAKAIDEAQPALLGNGPWSKNEVCVYLAPPGQSGLRITQQATGMLPPVAMVSELPDEVVIYREHPQVPISALDQLGPAWAAAYKAAPEQSQVSPHSRADITRWVQVD